MTPRTTALAKTVRACRRGTLLVPLGLALGAVTASAQVPLEAEMRRVMVDGHPVLLALLPLHNATALSLQIRVGRVFAQIPNDTAVVLGPEVTARVAPRAFALGPGASQVVGVTVDASAATAERYRLEVTVTDGRTATTAQEGGVRAVLTMATRYLVKLSPRTR